MNNSQLFQGQVVAAFGRHYQVELSGGAIVSCVTRGKRGGVACGDRVELRHAASGQGVIENVLPRSALLYRTDRYREKLIASNVTQIIIVVAAVPSYSEELINRCLVAAEHQGIRSLILLNKCDLAEETATAARSLKLYEDLGYALLKLSAKRDITPLIPCLKGQTSVLVGQSGMGKSTMINALLPSAGQATADISKALDSGRHTTTFARLYHLDRESQIIDSPGMQEFGLHHIPPGELAACFGEFRPYLGQCRFNNCRHLTEPGCALQRAYLESKISERRLECYRKLTAKM